jgi:hypothetical protein
MPAQTPDPDDDLRLLLDSVRDLKGLVDVLLQNPINLTPERCRQILTLVDALKAELDEEEGGK